MKDLRHDEHQSRRLAPNADLFIMQVTAVTHRSGVAPSAVVSANDILFDRNIMRVTPVPCMDIRPMLLHARSLACFHCAVQFTHSV